MKKGLELLNGIHNVIDIANLEEMHNLRLPPIFKIFASHFNLSEFTTEKYFSSKYSDYLQLTGVYYEPKGLEDSNIGITGLYPITKIFDYHQSLQGYTDDDLEKGLIRIADIGYGGGIFLGTKDNEVDSILLHSWDRAPQYEILSKDIFDFMRGVKSITTPENELVEAKYSQLYKNYEEDFWRVRDENV